PRAIFAGTAAGENARMLEQQRSILLPASISISEPKIALAAAAETLLALQDGPRAGVFVEALAKYPPSADAILLRGKWLTAKGELDEARRAFGSARQLDPTMLDANLGLVEVALTQKEYARAESLLRETAARNPDSIPVLASYVLLEKSRSHWAEAINWQTKRIAADPAPPAEAVGLLGELNFRAGNYAGAAHAYIDLLKRDAYNNDAHRVLGEIFRSAKRWDDARTQLEVVVRYSPAADPGQYISLADVYRNLGRPGDAQSMLDKGKRIFPGNSYLLHAAAE